MPLLLLWGSVPGHGGHPGGRPQKGQAASPVSTRGQKTGLLGSGVKGRQPYRGIWPPGLAHWAHSLSMHSCHCLPRAGHRLRLEAPAPLLAVRGPLSAHLHFPAGQCFLAWVMGGTWGALGASSLPSPAATSHLGSCGEPLSTYPRSVLLGWGWVSLCRDPGREAAGRVCTAGSPGAEGGWG